MSHHYGVYNGHNEDYNDPSVYENGIVDFGSLIGNVIYKLLIRINFGIKKKLTLYSLKHNALGF